MRNRIGPWVAGDDFHGREAALGALIERLRVGDHVSLAAQRRIGKTSLLHKISRRLEGEMTCVYVDLQHARDAVDAIVAIALATHAHQGLWTRVRLAFANVLGAVTQVGLDELTVKLRDGVLADWSAKGDRIVADVAAAVPPVVLMLDELPVLLVKLLRRNRDEAEAFLSWLRRACLAHTGALRVVVTGSIGLAPIAHRAGLSGALNHYAPMALLPWTPAEAERCLDRLAQTYEITWRPGARDEIIAQIGCCIPYHVQLYFQLLHEDALRRVQTSVSVADVQRVYQRRLLASHGHFELAHMEERLLQMFTDAPHQRLVIDLLTEAAVVGRLTHDVALALSADAGFDEASRARAVRDLLAVLEHDGYLEPIGREHRFVSKLLRDWWRARFGASHVAIDARRP